MECIICIIKQPSHKSEMTSNVNCRMQREIRFQHNCKQGHVCTLYFITICLSLIFVEACMFWEESILATITSLSLGLEASLLHLPTCNAFVSFWNYSLGRLLGRKTASLPPPSYLSLYPLVDTHTHTTNTQTEHSCSSSVIGSFQHHFSQGSLAKARKGHKGWNGCCHAHLKIFDPIHVVKISYTAISLW